MNASRVRSALVRLFPAAWRARYGDEFEALLEHIPVSPALAFDVVRAAAEARLNPVNEPVRWSAMTERLRRSELVILACWVGLAVAGAAFGKITEDPPLSFTRGSPLGTGLFYESVAVAAVVSALALAVAGFPIALAIARDGVRRRRLSQLALLCVPFLCVLGWIGVTRVLGTAPSGLDDELRAILVVVWLGSGLLAVVMSCVALAVAATRAEVDPRLYRRAVKPAWLTVIGMAVVTVSVACWGVVVLLAHPDDFWGQGGILSSSTALNWLAIVAVTVVATSIAAREARTLPRQTA